MTHHEPLVEELEFSKSVSCFLMPLIHKKTTLIGQSIGFLISLPSSVKDFCKAYDIQEASLLTPTPPLLECGPGWTQNCSLKC